MDCLLRLVIIQTPIFSKVRLSWIATVISRPSRIPLAQTFPECSRVGMFRIRYSGRQLRPPAQGVWQQLRRSVGWNIDVNCSGGLGSRDCGSYGRRAYFHIGGSAKPSSKAAN